MTRFLCIYKILIFLTLCSCAKIDYLLQQAHGQLQIQYDGVNNQELLADPNISEQVKKNVLDIMRAKTFFYRYFNQKPESIYSKTTLLDRDAVSYLVIVSPYDRVEALKTRFPIVGEFPYLGFFSQEMAQKYQKKQEKKGFVTYQRAVYAYSTLGYFEDRILSSFFQYNREDLLEMIFHELFHTIFFIKDEVQLNENLANYFGKELLLEYLPDPELREKKQREYRHTQERMELLVRTAKSLDEEYKKHDLLSRNQAQDILNQKVFQYREEVKNICQSQGLVTCPWEKISWNNARFASYLTYEAGQNFIHELRIKNKFSLAELREYLQKLYKDYKKNKVRTSFEDVLKKKASE